MNNVRSYNRRHKATEVATSFVHFKHSTWLERTELVAVHLLHCRVFRHCLVAQLAGSKGAWAELRRDLVKTSKWRTLHFIQGSRGSQQEKEERCSNSNGNDKQYLIVSRMIRIDEEQSIGMILTTATATMFRLWNFSMLAAQRAQESKTAPGVCLLHYNWQLLSIIIIILQIITMINKY